MSDWKRRILRSERVPSRYGGNHSILSFSRSKQTPLLPLRYLRRRCLMNCQSSRCLMMLPLCPSKRRFYPSRSSRWSRFDALEKRWANLEYTRTYSVSEREELDIAGEEADCTEQEGLWSDYQSYVQRYKSMGLSVKVYRVPIDKESFLCPQRQW